MNSLKLSFSELPENVLFSIFSCLSDVEILNFAVISKPLRNFITKSIDWGTYIMKRSKKPIFSNFIIAKSDSFSFFSPLLRGFSLGKVPPLFQSLFSSKNEEKLVLKPILASTTDYDQVLENALNACPKVFWSSLGDPTTDCQEFVILELENLSIIQDIKIKFYFSSWENKYYPCEFINVEFGLNCKNFDLKNKNIQRDADSREINIKLPLNFWVTKFIKINFINKVTIQDSDMKYYIAVEGIEIKGYQLKIKEILKIDGIGSADNKIKNLFRYGLEKFYEEKALKNSHNKTDLMKYIDFKNETQIDEKYREEFLKGQLVNLIANEQIQDFIQFKEEHPDVLNKKWFFELLAKKSMFIEKHFEEIITKRKRVYLNAYEFNSYFFYFIFEKNKEKIQDFFKQLDFKKCKFVDFSRNFNEIFGDFNLKISNFYYLTLSDDFFVLLIQRMMQDQLEKINENEKKELLIKQILANINSITRWKDVGFEFSDVARVHTNSCIVFYTMAIYSLLFQRI